MASKSDDQKVDVSPIMIPEVAHRSASPLVMYTPNSDPQSAVSSPKYSFPRSKIKILLMEKISDKAADFLRKQGFSVEQVTTYTPEELKTKIKDVHIMGVRSRTKLPKEILREGKKLLAVGCFCIGTDQTDLVQAAKQGVPVFNSPFANTRSVAELVMAMMVMLSRQAGDRNKECHQGKWGKTAKNCYEVRGKTLGIIGYGHVGSQLSILAEAFGCKVFYYDVVPVMPMGNAIAVNTMQEILTTCDFVSLHVPYTKLTDSMINRKAVQSMKKGAYLMNAARGKCVDIEAVADGIKSGHLGGAYFDVYPKEPIDANLVLANLPNVILTPHIGGATQEAQQNIGLEVARKLSRFINEGYTIGSVNFPNVDLPTSGERCHRIVHVHKNIPGVLKDINNILSDYNVRSQILSTTDEIGYLVVDLDADKALSADVRQKLLEMESTIKARVIYGPQD